MIRCPSCKRELATIAPFCAWCAAPLASEAQETSVMEAVMKEDPGPRPEASQRASSPIPVSSASVPTADEGRFVPGTVVAARYRIISLLGRGGMGEVYRATDLALGQQVALKFLPESLGRDDRAIARFYNEVRMARQVTHPNVCRVYDIGSTEGVHYISMEFVDGEDLASLLRRIGRLPADKALETARRLCAGLAAAHEKGMLHRDLKPANIMIDGRGQVIIMDFGLAGLAEQLQSDVRSGTPMYMSPEQLAGTEVTVKSDIYALGLVLYELFTGKRAFNANSLVELMQQQERGTPVSLTTLVRDLDPAIERVILRCLDFQTARRPNSPQAVAAALPGGDPLAAAMLAGETPSPELIAAAGETEGLRPAVAWIWLAVALIGIVAIGILAVPYFLTSKVPMDVPPEALARDARHMLESFGYTSRPADIAFGMDNNGAYLEYLGQHREAAAARWRNPAAGQPALILFWYRESPQPMVATLGLNTAINWSDPPPNVSGMITLMTDSQGRLLRLEVVPPQREAAAPPGPPFDWNLLYRAAGLDQSRFQSADAEWTPLSNWDTRAAWTSADNATGAKLRVEAAAWRGRPVFFRIIGPWTRPERMIAGTNNQILTLVVIYLAIAGASVLAWRNYRLRRTDLKSAWIITLIFFCCLAGNNALFAHHSAVQGEINVIWAIIAKAALNAGVLWLFYVALEPWVRKKWPHVLIGWTRFTTKGIRDPLVGRALLYGAVFACLVDALTLVRLRLHGPSGEPVMVALDPLQSVRMLAGGVLSSWAGSLFGPLLILFLLFVLRVLLRKEWAAAAVCSILIGILNTGAPTVYFVPDLIVNTLQGALFVFVIIRFGLLTAIVASTLGDFLLGLPRTLDFSLWYASMGMLPLVLMGLVAVYGFYRSVGSRPIFGAELE
ncbi:MAG TPA: serine/threonine-protein kinase [Verrucomicrobiae bacterium]|nr:serine/threonine-protein kinase [Verrucomicrobiae bacterium]